LSKKKKEKRGGKNRQRGKLNVQILRHIFKLRPAAYYRHGMPLDNSVFTVTTDAKVSERTLPRSTEIFGQFFLSDPRTTSNRERTTV